MSSSISSAAAAQYTPAPPTLPSPAERAAAAGIAASQTPATSIAQERAKLNQMVASYRADLTGGSSSQQLSALAKQITSAAKAAGVNITLPTASPAAEAVAATAATGTAAKPGVNLTV